MAPARRKFSARRRATRAAQPKRRRGSASLWHSSSHSNYWRRYPESRLARRVREPAGARQGGRARTEPRVHCANMCLWVGLALALPRPCARRPGRLVMRASPHDVDAGFHKLCACSSSFWSADEKLLVEGAQGTSCWASLQGHELHEVSVLWSSLSRLVTVTLRSRGRPIASRCPPVRYHCPLLTSAVAVSTLRSTVFCVAQTTKVIREYNVYLPPVCVTFRVGRQLPCCGVERSPLALVSSVSTDLVSAAPCARDRARKSRVGECYASAGRDAPRPLTRGSERGGRTRPPARHQSLCAPAGRLGAQRRHSRAAGGPIARRKAHQRFARRRC